MTMIPSRALFFSAQPPAVTKAIKTDYGALERTAVPNPVTNFGGSRFYGLGGLTAAPFSPVFVGIDAGDNAVRTTVNFGGSAFNTAPPTGFAAWGATDTLTSVRIPLANANLTAVGTGEAQAWAQSIGSHAAGKWYYEATITALGSVAGKQGVGVWNGVFGGVAAQFGGDINSIACFDDGTVYFGAYYPQGLNVDGSVTIERNEKDLLEAPFAVNDIIGVAIDIDNSKIWFRRNGGAWKCRGTTQAFGEFHIFAQKRGAAPVILDMESGDYLVIGFDMAVPFSAIKQLTVKGIGAKFTIRGPSGGMDLGSHAGFPSASLFNGFTDTFAIRLNPVFPGDTVLNVKSPLRTISTGAVTDLFRIGDWCCLDALELQGHGGYPPNQYNCEYVQIKALTNTQITLTAPVLGTYGDQYPDRYFGSPPGGDLYDPGGPATLHKMIAAGTFTPRDSWNIDLTINDLTIDSSASSQLEENIFGRKITLNNMNWINSEPNCSQSQRYTITGGTIGAFVEVDKSVQFLDISNVTFNASVHFQSATVQEASFTNCTFQQKLIGAAKNMTVKNSTIAETTQGLVLGNTYGQSRSLSLINVTAPIVSILSGQYLQAQGDPGFTYANGVFTSNPSAVWTIVVPGLGFLSAINHPYMQSFNIIDVQKTVDNRTVVITDLPYATLPSVLAVFGGPGTPLISWHPCPKLFVSGCSGSPHMVEWNDAYPQGLPALSYIKRTCTRDTDNYVIANDSATEAADIRGALVSISINVTRAYTGAQTNALFLLIVSAAITPDLTTQVLSSPFELGQIMVNTRIAGERIITPTTITGAQSGDTFKVVHTSGGAAVPLPFAFNFMDFVNSEMINILPNAGNYSGDSAGATAIVVVTIKTNQGSPFS